MSAPPVPGRGLIREEAAAVLGMVGEAELLAMAIHLACLGAEAHASDEEGQGVIGVSGAFEAIGGAVRHLKRDLVDIQVAIETGTGGAVAGPGATRAA